MNKRTLQTILVISLAINVAFFTFLLKAEKDIRALNDFYATRRQQLTENASQYNEEIKFKTEEKVLALKKGIADLGSVKMNIEKDKSYTIVNYREFYKNLYTYIDKHRYLNEDVSEWLRNVGNSLYVSIDNEGAVKNGIPSSLGKPFCDLKQMAFCYTFLDNSLSAPKYEYRMSDGASEKITKAKVEYVLDNAHKFASLRQLYAYFNNIDLQEGTTIGNGIY